MVTFSKWKKILQALKTNKILFEVGFLYGASLRLYKILRLKLLYSKAGKVGVVIALLLCRSTLRFNKNHYYPALRSKVRRSYDDNAAQGFAWTWNRCLDKKITCSNGC